MYIEERADLIGDGREQAADRGAQPSRSAAVVGRVIAVSGSQATLQLAADRASGAERDAGLTVGALLGIDTGKSLAIGALCELSLTGSASAHGGAPAIGRIDLVGEIRRDAAGNRQFHRGIMAYPRLDSAAVGVGRDELQIIFDATNPGTIQIGRLQQNEAIPAYVNVDELVQKHFAIVGSTGAGKSTALALILHKIMQARGDLA